MALKELSSPQRLSTRLIIVFGVIILITTFVAGVPAYLFIRAELENEAWKHVANGGKTTHALLDAEQKRLISLATLTSQRPTLKNYLLVGDEKALAEYLEAYQAGVDIELLIVQDVDGGFIAGGGNFPDVGSIPLISGATYLTINDPSPGLLLAATKAVIEEGTNRVLGYVIVGVSLNGLFCRQLAQETGFEHSVLINDTRISSSLTDNVSKPDGETVQRIYQTGLGDQAITSLSGFQYYQVLVPLFDAQSEVVAIMEVNSPVDDLLQAEKRAFNTLVICTCLVTVFSSGFGYLFARKLTAPLMQLTSAAQRVSEGDFSSPIEISRETYEISVLTTAFAESRKKVHDTLEKLSQANAWLETLVGSIVEGIITVDMDERITSFSQGAERITGWSSQEVVGSPINQVIHCKHPNETLVGRCFPHNGTRQVNIKTLNNREVTLSITSAKMPLSDGNSHEEIAMVLRDITEEKAIQNLRAYFLANISHEFRTPLSALNASVELLLDELEHYSLAEIRELLNSIHLSVSGLQALIDNLLESMSIEAGHFKLRPKPSNLNTIVLDAVRLMEPLLNRRRQELLLSRWSRLPLVNIDPTRITQVLVNLLSNASKFGPMGEEIILSLEESDNRSLSVTVSDRGPGVSQNEREDIFKRFVQLDSGGEAQYGIGLGLSVVKAIIEEHGGEVGVSEREGGGSKFWFTLPIDGGTA
ncbi:MAG: ATP-binding protein [Anaerolineales bacterium]|jgi:PAS domain S-box-containing protein